MKKITAQSFDRLSKSVMLRHGLTYKQALEFLSSLNLRVLCGEDIRGSAALQAALITVMNVGKRAFRGGISLEMPPDVQPLFQWPGNPTLNEIAVNLGAKITRQGHKASSTIAIGTVKGTGSGLRIFCDGWRGGVFPFGESPVFSAGADFSTGGVFAAGFAVARSFLSAAEICNRDILKPTGFSLWRPDLSWLDHTSAGPELTHLPEKLWLLGLGHLGQAYTWAIGLLPSASKQSMTVFLQDFDPVEDANWSAGLLCEHQTVGLQKTRVNSDWLEQRGFETRIIERPFDENTIRREREPRIGLCGFDNAKSRRLLDSAGFDLVVECGLGGSLARFDRLTMRTFPDASYSPAEIWSNSGSGVEAFDLSLLGESEEECGIVFQEIAGKAISSAFTGACASALVVGEVLRAIHGGQRCEILSLHLRDLERPVDPYRDENYQLRVAPNGLLKIASKPRPLPVEIPLTSFR